MNTTTSHDAESLAIARTLSQALPFMRRYAGKTVVVKYGGHAMGDEKVAHDLDRKSTRLNSSHT